MSKKYEIDFKIGNTDDEVCIPSLSSILLAVCKGNIEKSYVSFQADRVIFCNFAKAS